MQPTVDARVEVVGVLSPDDLQSVSALAAAATEADGQHPLSEQTMLALPSTIEGPSRHILVFARRVDPPSERGGASHNPERLAGYAHLHPSDLANDSSAEVVVHPDLRGHGIGQLVVEQLLALSPGGRLRLWAHGQQPAAQALAAALGFVSSRELLQLRRPLTGPLPPVEIPAGYALRTFSPGVDDETWLAVNAAAFADHPEQGSWTLDDLHQRMAEEWFDPNGFLVLDGPDGEMAGFHWTKVHGQTEGQRPIGEVYVVGVAPTHQGRGLGRVLTLAGLHHLRSRGLQHAMLYVDADNVAAVQTYTALGFTRWNVDVQYSRDESAR